MIACLAAWGLWGPVAAADAVPEPAASPVSQQEAIYRDFLQSVSDLWFLLSGIGNEAEADSQAPAFTDLVRRICILDEQLSATSTNSGLTVEVEAEVHENAEKAEAAETLEQLQIRIMVSYDDVLAEFLGLCRRRCYGSEKLKRAFIEASEVGMFAEDTPALLETPRSLTPREATAELGRMKRLAEPDRAVLHVLEQVEDAVGARKAVSALSPIFRRYRKLYPAESVQEADFAEDARPQVNAAFEDIAPLLWGIRTELVRIASLPDYDSAAFDLFSDTIEILHGELCRTHRGWYPYVFDSSFRTDLDDASAESIPSSTATE